MPESSTARGIDRTRLTMRTCNAICNRRWIDRFKAIEEDAVRSAFRDKLGGYVRMYSFLSQILPYGDSDLERLCSYS